jgi:uncharacterized LabA/DUF88 family protein
MRAAFYIDGFNLYHAIDRLNRPHLKWVSLWHLAALVIPQRTQLLSSVVYFSAYSTHVPERMARHRAYVAALEANGVETVMGRFKLRPMRCHKCQHRWEKPEEKETDVNIAIRLVQDAYEDEFDIAYVVSGDSDLAPALRLVVGRFEGKQLISVSPPGRPHSQELLAATRGRKLKLRAEQLEHCLLPDKVFDSQRRLIATRPSAYDMGSG